MDQTRRSILRMYVKLLLAIIIGLAVLVGGMWMLNSWLGPGKDQMISGS